MTGDTLRERFAKYGVEVLLATALSEWKGSTARLMNLYTGETEEREFDSLVLATTNTPEDRLTKELAAAGLELHAIGDTVAARSASMAFYEGRKLALAL
jgi:thioredoxin reductase